LFPYTGDNPGDMLTDGPTEDTGTAEAAAEPGASGTGSETPVSDSEEALVAS
jgi:hypothetical protein